jgi:hypothetical protein
MAQNEEAVIDLLDDMHRGIKHINIELQCISNRITFKVSYFTKHLIVKLEYI